MSWKDHPVAAAAVTCVATLGVCYKLLIPVYTSTLEDKVLRDSDEISALQEELYEVKEKVKRLEVANSVLISESVLKPCNPYPISLDYIKVGDPLQKVVDTYSRPEYELDKNKNFAMVSFPGNSVFSGASYMTTDAKKISAILFFYSGVKLPQGKGRLQESPQQLGILKQVKDAFPNAIITKREDSEEPGYDVNLEGKTVIMLNPSVMSVWGTAVEFSKCRQPG